MGEIKMKLKDKLLTPFYFMASLIVGAFLVLTLLPLIFISLLLGDDDDKK